MIGLDEINNDRTNTTHNDTSSMQVHQRLTTISTFAPGGNILIVNFYRSSVLSERAKCNETMLR